MQNPIFYLILLTASFLFANCKSKSEASEAHELNADEERYIVKLHNSLRAQVSPPATDMLALRYDEELARVARDYSRQCQHGYNPSAYTDLYDMPGESMYLTSGVTANMTRVLHRAINKWFSGRKNYSYEKIKCVKRPCGQYTEMVWAENEAIGCGVTTCRNMRIKSRLFARVQVVVCNYGPGGNYRGERPYRTGPTCSQCPAGRKCICGDEN